MRCAPEPDPRSPGRWGLLPVACLLASVLAGLPSTALAQHAPQTAPEIPDPTTVTAEAWQEDLRFLAERLPEQHPYPWHHVTEEEFGAAVNRLHGRIPELSYPEILVGFMEVVALLGPGDGHSRVRIEPPFVDALYPLRLWWFADGLYVRSAAPQFVNLVGKRVLFFGS